MLTTIQDKQDAMSKLGDDAFIILAVADNIEKAMEESNPTKAALEFMMLHKHRPSYEFAMAYPDVIAYLHAASSVILDHKDEIEALL